MCRTRIFLFALFAIQIVSPAQAGVAFWKEECPSGYSRVPRNSSYVPSDFCVMKYEARARDMTTGTIDVDGCNEAGCTTADWGLATNVPYSTATGIGWRMISQINAKAMCRSLGSRYDLISNSEWQTIARNTELVDKNWSGGTVGSGCMFIGNSNANTTCGYAGSQPEGGTGRNTKARLFLSNGQEVWDMSGNLKEWVLDDNSTNYGADAYTYAITTGTHTTMGTLNDGVGRVAKDQFGPSGTYASCSTHEQCGLGHAGIATPTGAIQRGGRWEGDWTGIFSVSDFTLATASQFGWGFRCVYHPKDVKVIFLTSGTSWTVPNDWSNIGNKIEVIGGGGGGGGNSAHEGDGGCGGGYSLQYNVALTAGATVTYQIGAAGGGGSSGNGGIGGNGTDTYFCNNTSNCASIAGTAVVVGAKGGGGGQVDGVTLASPGAAASGVGTIKFSGGQGGKGSHWFSGWGGGGGGGAAGPNGNGAAGGHPYSPSGSNAGGGGGGANGGSAGGNATSNTVAGDGGANRLGAGAGAHGGTGSAGTNGGGGGGGGNGGRGGNGSQETLWTQTSDGTLAGPGSGGGGGSSSQIGGDSGGYGAGGGGTVNNNGGAGSQGFIVITYTPR